MMRRITSTRYVGIRDVANEAMNKYKMVEESRNPDKI